jgi:anti-sigma-K factor RskA
VNIKDYIGSGILEAYALGALPEGERAQVEANVAQYPELAAELRSIEAAMQLYAEKHAMQPPPAMEDKIWAAIQQQAPAGNPAPRRETPKTIPLPPPAAKPAVWKYAAMVAMLIGSVALNIILYNQNKEERTERLAMGERMAKLEAEQQQLAQQTAHYAKANEMMADTAMQTIVMHTVVTGHPMAATVYWNKNRGETYVAMNALPKPPEGMQYQLWVIQDGKPVSMGVLPNDMASTASIQKIPMAVASGQAFAISLEKAGGNPTPTQVYVLGKV